MNTNISNVKSISTDEAIRMLEQKAIEKNCSPSFFPMLKQNIWFNSSEGQVSLSYVNNLLLKISSLE